MTSKRLKSPYRPLHRRQTMSIDNKGFVYVGTVKFCRYSPDSEMLEFRDWRRTQSQGQRIIEVSVSDFTGQLERLFEQSLIE